MTRGLILLAHGARDKRWATPFEDMAERIRRRRPGLHVRLAFLEFMTPDLRGAGAELVAVGCTRVTLVPMFLGAGGHVRKDVPQQLAHLRDTHPDVHFGMHTAIGEIDTVLQAMAEAALAALEPESAA